MFFISIWFGFNVLILKNNVTLQLDKTSCTVFRMSCSFKCLLSKQKFIPLLFLPKCTNKTALLLFGREKRRSFTNSSSERGDIWSLLYKWGKLIWIIFGENYIGIIKSRWKLSFPSRNSKENWSQLVLVKFYRKPNGETPSKLCNDLQILWGLSVEKCKFLSTLAFHS